MFIVPQQSRKKRSIDPSTYILNSAEEGEPEILPTPLALADQPIVVSVAPYFYHKRSVEPMDDFEKLLSDGQVPLMSTRPLWRRKRDMSLPPDHVIGKSPHVVHYTVSIFHFRQNCMHVINQKDL